MHNESTRVRFGEIAEHYDASRPGMPIEVLDFLRSNLRKGSGLDVLDVGCGTGIVTRQLAQLGMNPVGIDIDKKMIDVARRRSGRHIPYFISPAEDIPFAAGQFDAVTAWSSFHWFANMSAACEMRRVLRRRGSAFVANRNHRSFQRTYLDALRPFVGQIRDAKTGYAPAIVLADAGFDRVSEQSFSLIERWTVDMAVTFVESTCCLCALTDAAQLGARDALRAAFDQIARDNVINKETEIHVTLAHA